jgi:hypothetical protein
MKQLFISLITLLSLSSFAQDAVVNDNNAQQRTLSSPFTAITVSDGVDLYLTQSDEESMAVSASDEKYMENFKTEVVNGTLKIYYDHNGFNWVNTDKRKLKAYVSFKTLEKLSASSGASVMMKSTLTSDRLECKFTSGARFEGKVNITELEVSQNSGSSVDISGATEKLDVGVNSGAMFKGYELTVDYCEAKASSGGGVRVHVKKELSAKANSGGGIRYKGDGVIKDLDVNSGGQVKRS